MSLAWGDIAFWRRSIAGGRCQATAKDLRMRYRAVWCRIKASEERLGKPLVAREGRGSCLTPLAKKPMKQYRRIQAVVENESDEIYNDLIVRAPLLTPGQPRSRVSGHRTHARPP